MEQGFGAQQDTEAGGYDGQAAGPIGSEQDGASVPQPEYSDIRYAPMASPEIEMQPWVRSRG
jgi:hypothetical protein